MKKMTLNNIYEWPLMTRLLILGLVFSGALFLGYHFDISNQSLKLSRAIQQESDLRQQLEIVIHHSKILQTEVSHLPDLKNKLQVWKKQLVSNDEMPQLLNQILKIGADNHLFFSLFTPGEPVTVKLPSSAATPDAAAGAQSGQPAASARPAAPAPTAPTNASQAGAQPQANVITYVQVPIKVVVVGSFNQIADFISQLANMDAIVVVDNFTISNENKTELLGDKMAKQAVAQHLLSAEMVLEVYHLPEGKA